MKIKLISLLIALLCVSVLFVSCSDECTTHLDADGDGICDTEGCEDVVQIPEPEEPDCTDHKDENKDGLCDTENCDTAIITNTIENEVEIIVPITKEEYVPMVVKPIPADAVVSDYVFITYEGGVLTLYTHAYNPVESAKVVMDLGSHYYIIKTSAKVSDPVADDPATSETDESKYATRKDTYTLINELSGFSVELITTEAYDYVDDNPATTDENEFWSDAPSFSFIDDYGNFGYYRVNLGGKYYFYTENYTRINDKALESTGDFDFAYGNNNTKRFIIDETIYVVDDEGNIINTESEIFFIDRPEFDYMTDAFGIVEQDGKLCFFDLTKWMECSYVYEFALASEYEWHVLQNGSVFAQQMTMLPSDAVNFDLVYDDYKVDIDNFIIDPAAKTVTEVEFGYLVQEVMVNDGENEFISDKAENIFMVATIVNGAVAEGKLLVVNNALDILCDVSDIAESEPVADGLYIKEVEYNGDEYEAIYDATGKFLNYLPENYEVFDDCIILGGKGVYTYDLKLKLDLTKYSDVDIFESYMLLEETVKTKKMEGEGDAAHEVEVITYKYYYWNTSLEAPALLFDSTSAKRITDSRDDYFTVEVPTIVVDEATQQQTITGYTKTVYSNDGKTVICTGVDTYEFDEVYIDGETYVTLYVSKTIPVEGGVKVTNEYYIVNTTAPAPAPAPAA